MYVENRPFFISEKNTKDWLEYSQICTKVVDLEFKLQFMSTAGITALCIDDIHTYYNKPYPLEFYPQPYQDIWKRCYEEAKSTHSVVRKDILAVSLEGEELWFDSTFIPVFDENDILDYIIVTSVYISERKNAEKSLAELNSKLESLVVERTNTLEEVNQKLDEQAAHAKHYQKSLIEWTKIDFEDLDLALQKGVKISSDAMNVERVSIWSLNEAQNEIKCEVMYIQSESKFTSGSVLFKNDYPKYFNALLQGNILAISNAREDSTTREFTEFYLKPLDIYSMLDIPILKEGKVVGVICYEATKKERHWTTTEIDFASATANSIALAFEIEHRRKIEQELNHQAHHDSLTGLPNRVLFNKQLEYSIKEAKRNNNKIALLFIDLDYFKEINDSLGHNIGDKVLSIITSKLHNVCREVDFISRLGGDEFTIILNDLVQAQDASLIAEKILLALSETIHIDEHVLNISSSIGISIYPDDGKDPESLLKYADSAMYKAKDEGRNNYQYYSLEMTELAFERIVMQTAIKTGIQNEEFRVYYQAQVNGVTNELTGMEALVRWDHPTMGLVSPAKFIPLAESTGLIVDLDRYVMKSAMKQIVKWYEQGLNPGVIALNLSVKQLKQDDFIEVIKSLFQETKCKPEWVELEITESQVMQNPEEGIKLLKTIRELGIELAIDDFGTGYSSLVYLKKLPINKLKIDQEFIRGLPGDEEDVGITKAVIALAKSLNLKVIAEGVETKEQKDFIVKNGCDNIQGYFYSKPIPTDKFEQFLKDRLEEEK